MKRSKCDRKWTGRVTRAPNSLQRHHSIEATKITTTTSRTYILLNVELLIFLSQCVSVVHVCIAYMANGLNFSLRFRRPPIQSQKSAPSAKHMKIVQIDDFIVVAMSLY